jgi:hypothetical protein
VDGVQVASADYLADINPPDIPYLSLGAALNLVDPMDPLSGLAPDPNTPSFLSGPADDVGLWNRALSLEEVTKIYQAGLQHQSLTTVVLTPGTVPATITTTVSGSNLVVAWSPAGGTLQSTTSLPGTGATWGTVGTANPATVPIGATGNLFLRVSNP